MHMFDPFLHQIPYCPGKDCFMMESSNDNEEIESIDSKSNEIIEVTCQSILVSRVHEVPKTVGQAG